MSTTLGTQPVTTRVRQPWQGVARVLMGVVGAQLLAGAVYFTFLAAPEDGGVANGFDWFVAVWALAVAPALVVVAVLRRSGGLPWGDVARWVVLVHAVWALVKLVSYDELVVSLVALFVDAVILGLLWWGARKPS